MTSKRHVLIHISAAVNASSKLGRGFFARPRGIAVEIRRSCRSLKQEQEAHVDPES